MLKSIGVLALGVLIAGAQAVGLSGPGWPNSASAAESAAESTAAAPGETRAEFDRILSEFKDVLAELRALQIRWQGGNEAERAEVRRQWQPVVDKGEALQARLLATAQRVVEESPADQRPDKQIVDLLRDVVLDEVQADNFEPAFNRAQLLIEHGADDAQLFNLGGIAAFATSRFGLARQWLTSAQEKGQRLGIGRQPLDDLLQEFFRDPDYYLDAWAKEQRLRQAEAKADDLPRVVLKTSKGEIELELFENEAPNTVANFVSLVEKGFYDGLTFHRVLAGFVAQGGCPKGNGTGGPGYTIACECYRPDHRIHFRGSLSMAHAGRDTGGSQFFLTFIPLKHLDGRHTVFGRVVRGMEVLHKLQRRDPAAEDPPEPDRILKATVVRKRDHAYEPKTAPDPLDRRR